MTHFPFSDFCLAIKMYAFETGGTLVFVVFIAIETKRAIEHILELGRKDK